MPLTDLGKLILKFLQDNEQKPYSSKEISEKLFISCQSTSIAFRKLVSEGFVTKIGKNPNFYLITNKGKNYIIKEKNFYEKRHG